MNALKTVVQKWKDMNAILRILIGLAIGLVLGLTVPNLPVIGLLGSIFVGSLKGIAPILVFVLIMSSLANSSTGIGSRFRTVIFLYMTSTLVASIVAVITSYLFPVTMKLTGDAADQAAPTGVGEVWTNLLNNMVTNPVSALANANYIGILFWAVLFGLALKAIGSEKTNNIIAEIADMINKVVTWIILLAPFGVMGLVFNAISENGLAIFTVYGKLVAALVGSMLFVTLVTDPFIAALFLKRNPYPLTWTALKESGLTAFFTRSSAANIPVNMKTCEKLGLEKDFYSVSIPLGATINMDGAAAVITIMSLAVARTMGVEVSIPTAIALSFLSTLAACGASGVAGGSLLLIPMACSFFGISNDIAMQAVEVGFIIGVIQDSVETALNSSGDVVFSATSEYYTRRKRGEDMRFLGEYAKKKKDAPAE
ncbi:MAG: serine/threonine transporter SstT, partial [Clostridia bacterium]|nr:serine/threonine transporter SstT [Clostridia bacterium]